MNGFTADYVQDEYSKGPLDSGPDLQRLCESILNTETNITAEDILSSCPIIGIQTPAETTSGTGSLRPDGVSSLPLGCR